MKDEIKEILETLKNNNCYSNFIDDINGGNEYYYLLEKSEGNLLLDYITNLQKERDMYKGSFETMSKNYFEEKLKNEKAIDYIDINSKDWNVDYDDNYYEWYTGFEEENIKELLNILQGEDE